MTVPVTLAQIPRMKDHGAPPSLSMQASRTVEQEALVLHVDALARQARALLKELEANRNVERQGLVWARAFLKLACHTLRCAITREDFF